jgi:mono/diheme cytochrome c family protein
MSARSSAVAFRSAAIVLAGALIAVTFARVTAAQGNPAVPSLQLPPGQGLDVVQDRCFACHGIDLIRQQRLSRPAWAREVDKMIGWGSALTDDQKDRVLVYLASYLGVGMAPGVIADADADAGRQLMETRCVVCHDDQLIEQQRLTAAGWTREIDKMIGWGATLTGLERDTLSNYLAARFAPILRPR